MIRLVRTVRPAFFAVSIERTIFRGLIRFLIFTSVRRDPLSRLDADHVSRDQLGAWDVHEVPVAERPGDRG